MSDYSSRQLAQQLALALAATVGLAIGLGVAIGLLLGKAEGVAFVAGSLIVAAPQAWLAISLFSRFSAAPTVLGIGKFSISAVLFAVWFSTASEPSPGTLFAGAILALFVTPVVYYWQGRR